MHDITDPDIHGRNNEQTKTDVTGQNVAGSPPDDDGMTMRRNGADNFRQMGEIFVRP